MPYEFTTHEIPAMDILSIREHVEPDRFPGFLGGAFPELFTHVGRHGIVATGQPFVIYHAFGPELIDAEVCVPVIGPAPTEGRIAASALAAATVIRTLHVGPYEELGGAYAALSEWVDDHGYQAVGPIRERYLTGIGDDVSPSDYRTELDMPVEVVAAEAAGRPGAMAPSM